MKKRTLYQMGIHALSGLLMAMPVLASTTALSQAYEDNENTLSPYFMIPKGGPVTDAIPLLSTSADVRIAGVIADVTITQVYKNEGKNPIEAIYVFPASTRAAVYSMQMTIGERKIIAIIKERQQARADYEAARANGQSASLLEQERPNVFTMNVANIMPGDKILVEMSYTELLIPEGGVYEFVYPTVVGPRYSNTREDIASNTENWIRNPYTLEGESPLYDFDIAVSISAGLPIQEVSCATHKMDIDYEDPSVANLKLKDDEAVSGNRDMIIRYRLAGGQIESGLLLFEGKEENFFLAMVQPPARPEAHQIPAREYVFIVDVSGSMWGFPLDVSKEMMRKLLSKLKPTDCFNILLFSGGSSLFSERSVPATESNINKGIAFIDKQHGGGGTELLPALRRALALERMEQSMKFKGLKEYARSFVILTDGYVSVEKEAFDLIRNNLGTASFFPFGIGSGVNHYLIEGMAHAGMGTPFIVNNEEQASAIAEKFRKYIQQPVLTNINIAYEGFEAYDVEPLSMADVFAERPLIIYGKYRGNAKGSIKITGTSGEGDYTKLLAVNDAAVDENNAALTYLWAREKIKMLDDYASLNMYTNELEEEITGLGLKYNLLTQYTSFVAIDNLVRNDDGTYTTVSQPLPLPEGVSNYAVGGVPNTMQKSHSGRKYMPGGGSVRTMACEEFSLSLDDVSVEDKPDEVFVLAEQMAEFKGSKDGLEEFIRENIIYPLDALAEGLEGKVYIEFVIDTDGSISDVAVVSSTDPAFETEAIRVIKLTNLMWKAARNSGKKVKSRMVLEVAFVLEE